MFSTNFLLAILEWLQGKFETTAQQHEDHAEVHDEVIKQRTLLKKQHQSEAQRARNFANKIGQFLG